MKEHLLEKADFYLSKRQDKELRALLAHHDFHVIAEVIEALTNGRRKAFNVLPPEKQAEVALVLSEESQDKIFPRLTDETLARFLHFNDEDDATDILQHLSNHRRANILKLMKDDKRKKIEKLLRYGSETAGGVMDLNFIGVQLTDSYEGVREKIRSHMQAKRHMPTVLVLDVNGHSVGFIPERTLVFPPQKAVVEDVMLPLHTIHHAMDRENVMQEMSRLRVEVLAVRDDRFDVLGVIHLRDLMKVAQEEATEDIYRFAGVDVEEHALDPIRFKVKRRYNWLLINLLTAFLASFVVGLFEGTIARFAILAVYMPIVAGQGGNAATQALVVVVRGLALGEIGWSKAQRVIFREGVAGMTNGIITGTFASLASFFLGAPMILGAILAASMIINLTVAGLFGALIPFVLKRLRIDPAIASSVFVTTMTDCCGFFVFLGLGTMFMK